MATITLPRADLPIAGQFQASGDWYRWARDITVRVGGVTGTTSAVIEATANEALSRAALDRTRVPLKDVRQGDGITVTLDAAGYSVALDTGYLLNAVRAYTPRQPSPKPVEFDQLINAVRAFLPRPTPQMAPDDAQAVLANRVFSH